MGGSCNEIIFWLPQIKGQVCLCRRPCDIDPSPPAALLAMDDAIVQLHSWIIVRANCLCSNASSLPPHAYLSGFCVHQLVLWARTNEHTHTLCHVNYTKCQWTTVVRIFMHLLRVLKRYSMQRQYLHTNHE